MHLSRFIGSFTSEDRIAQHTRYKTNR